MDRLEQLIADKQTEIDRLQAELEKLSARHQRLAIELEALKQAARARPIRTRISESNNGYVKPPSAKKRGRKGGRQAGDISQAWRRVLGAIWLNRQLVTYTDVQKIAAENGTNTKMPNIRERVRSMIENGLMGGDATKGFHVTPEAAARFGFKEADAA